MYNEHYKHFIFPMLRLLVPGGTANLKNSQYAKIGSLFYKMAIESNDKGDFFPVMGICLGFELLAVLQAGTRNEILTNCTSNNQALKLTFFPGIDPIKIYSVYFIQL